MGTKYSTVTVSGYNSTPPADDGSQTAANQVKWSTIKTKLPDPLKTAIEAINSAIVTTLDFGSRQVTSSDTTVAADHMKTVEIAPTVSTAITVSLGDAATMAAGYIVTVKNSSVNNQTVGRITAGDKIDATAANVTLLPKESRTFKVANTASEGYLQINSYGIAPNLTGHVTSVGAAAVLGSFTLAQLNAAISDANVGNTLVAEIASTSGTSIDFTGIPWVRRITIMFDNVSTSGTSLKRIQIGDSGGIETSGYSSVGARIVGTVTSTASSTAGFDINSDAASDRLSGSIVLTAQDEANNVWTCHGSLADGVAALASYVIAGGKSLSGVLDRVRITTLNGTDTFDLGAISISYET